MTTIKVTIAENNKKNNKKNQRVVDWVLIYVPQDETGSYHNHGMGVIPRSDPDIVAS